MLKLVGLFIGLAAIAAARTEPPHNTAALSVQMVSAPPQYAMRDVFGTLDAARP